MEIYDISRDIDENIYPGDPESRTVRIKSISDGDDCNLSAVYMGAHNGTHLDAPLHFIDDAMSVDEISLKNLIGPCTVINMSPGFITGEVVEKNFPKVDRILIHGKGKAFLHKTGAEILVDNGVLLVGTDANSIEPSEAEGAAHNTLLENGVPILENIDLTDIPSGEYFLFAVPIKIKDCEAAPVRAVLIKGPISFQEKIDFDNI